MLFIGCTALLLGRGVNTMFLIIMFIMSGALKKKHDAEYKVKTVLSNLSIDKKKQEPPAHYKYIQKRKLVTQRQIRKI